LLDTIHDKNSAFSSHGTLTDGGYEVTTDQPDLTIDKMQKYLSKQDSPMNEVFMIVSAVRGEARQWAMGQCKIARAPPRRAALYKARAEPLSNQARLYNVIFGAVSKTLFCRILELLIFLTLFLQNGRGAVGF
jgi:hypothetical protein